MRPFETVFERLYFHERFRMFQCRWWQKRIKRYWCGGGLRVKSVVLVSLFTHQSNNWIFTLWHIDGNWRREIFKRYSRQESIMVETLNQKISLMRAGRLIWKISSVKEIFNEFPEIFIRRDEQYTKLYRTKTEGEDLTFTKEYSL